MLPPRFTYLARAASALLLSALLTCAHAVELGDAQVRSHIGQPLWADIELTGIASEAATLQAGLASPDVYGGANIAMHPVLSALKITIIERGGRRFLHIASTRAVETEFVNIFFELTENGRRVVRQSTLWLTVDPNPAPPPPPPVPAPAPAPVRAPVIAAPRPPAFAVASMAPMLRAAPPARPTACVQQFTAAQIGTCAALDGKNAELSAQVAELEDKVRLLSLAMHAQAAQRPRITAMPAVPAHAPAAKSTGATPWRFIAIASAVVFSLVGVLAFFLLRKRNTSKSTSPVNAILGWIAGTKRRLLPAKKAPKRPVNVEPTGA